MRVPRTVAVPAGGAVIVGALESQRTEYTLDLLAAPTGITCCTPARTTNPGTDFIGKVSVETLLNGVGREPQSPLAQGDFQGLEIQLREGFPT
jgi:hypothetical protein